MRKWRVTVYYDNVIEAEDEGYALMQADGEFNFMSQARATEIEPDDDEPMIECGLHGERNIQ